MKRRLRILRPALVDLDDQALYFEEQRPGLGRRFSAAARRTFDRIGRLPETNARYGFRNARLADVRACQIESFPNLIAFYRVVDGTSEVLRVLHAARDIDAMTDEILPE